MDNLGVTTIPTIAPYYVLYYVAFSKLIDSMPGQNTMKSLYVPTLQDALDLRCTLLYFMQNWNMGFHGGEIVDYIGHRVFSYDESSGFLIASNVMINMNRFLQKSEALRQHKCNVRNSPLQKNMYDEYMLTVLRLAGFLPRIYKKNLIPFSCDYIETSEEIVREMKLVI